MSIKVKQCTMVCPARETPRKSLWLSNLDLIIRSPFSHTEAVFIYHCPSTNDSFFDVEVLKDALSRALVPFYPMAGRLRHSLESGRLEIDCNGEGALFIEAETTHYSLADFDEHFTLSHELEKMMIPTCDYSGGISSFPLLLVQLTRFHCGGVSLGFAQNHQVADGTGHLHFINSWARLAKGLELEVLPFHERNPHLASRHPPQVKFNHFDQLNPPQGLLGNSQLRELFETTPTTVSIFNLSKDQVNALKQKAASLEMKYNPTSFEVIAGHVWRCACKARGLVDEQEVRVIIPVDGRSRLKDPALPQGYCGNVIFSYTCVAKAGEITRNPLWYAVSKICEYVRRVNDEEYLRSLLDYLETLPDLTARTRAAHLFKCPNLSVNYFARLPFYEADFGWGRPVFGGPGGLGYEGRVTIMPNPNEEGSFLVNINLCQAHMPLFDKYMYDEFKY